MTRTSRTANNEGPVLAQSLHGAHPPTRAMLLPLCKCRVESRVSGDGHGGAGGAEGPSERG